jgi:catechol 2,3-dioxygenase-like lactoylglutathione lyase family enzyme
MDAAPSTAGRWHHAIPILRVASLEASRAYYVNVLGFRVDWDAGGIASFSRDECCVFLCEGGQGHAGGWVWLGVGDVQVLWRELAARGALIRNPPTNYFWALEMQVTDPDGNVLRIGSDPLPGVPFGEFLDMHGQRWPTASATDDEGAHD